jgi:hypothetical protein
MLSTILGFFQMVLMYLENVSNDLLYLNRYIQIHFIICSIDIFLKKRFMVICDVIDGSLYIILIPLSQFISDVLSCKNSKIARCDVNRFMNFLSHRLCPNPLI